MTLNAGFVPGKRKYVICGDQEGLKQLSCLIERIKEEGLLHEIFVWEGHVEDSQLSNYLMDQKMGTYLYVAVPHRQLQKVKRVVEVTGLTDEEARYIGYGEKVIRVFCCRCHEVNEVTSHLKEIKCHQCKLELSVSDHYSVYHNAVLGYVAKL
ncbi:hypothetical protein [Fictibacillus phosphorivorans]|uniref:hypothetical protein n=1 Tax=Fictibacillus phosphorivorans TaxID=1221500 RepID=UPI00203CFA46|nr:hypothetical protein [Fictibacillus phosphorivorans]MCM3719906.1 hypothetical protein [Fictibacillus phosphorivorans]MCM3777640.1 hypothetical protein [Fictibacillus phosphorivorans]